MMGVSLTLIKWCSHRYRRTPGNTPTMHLDVTETFGSDSSYLCGSDVPISNKINEISCENSIENSINKTGLYIYVPRFILNT